ncbi:heparinase II/III family protein [Altererythrobacter litoralis]|uniref:Heparinase II/III family protein n=1 Tax=Altererythrobacter litoralis TaxID=3113904 RepID=A0ABU7GBI0_9SPHN|nr:heparinase II/III family protein [Erythrobacteraceae bacterium 1XM1-14]
MDALLSGQSEHKPEEDLFGEIHADAPALPLKRRDAQPVARVTDEAAAPPVTEVRALVLSDFVPPKADFTEKLVRFAYRFGVGGATLTAPFRKPARPRLLATVESPLAGDRTAGMALRAGHFLIHGVKAPIGEVDYASSSRMAPPFERVIHGFAWLRDLAAAGQREQCVDTAERITRLWLDANPKPGKCAAWQVEHAAHRLIAWLVHAPLVLSGQNEKLRPRLLAAIDDTARWLDHEVRRAPDPLSEVLGWGAITAAGLLMPQGKPRRLYGEAGLIAALGDFVGEDGGALSRSPMAQMDAIAMLTDLEACYKATGRDLPASLGLMRELLVPPLLAMRHGDGGLGSWQGNGATRADRLAALLDASGVRTRPLKDVRHWGYHRLAGGKTVVQIDAAPPPRARHARWGCASTLAFEMSDGPHRLIVNCGGAALAGGQVPARIEQGLRATAAHSALVLDNANSTAVLLGGKLGKGVEQVEVERGEIARASGEVQRIEASHDGYLARYGLIHRRILMLRGDGTELLGEDILLPPAKKGQRGKVGFAIRFHLGRGVEARLAEDRRGASLVLPDGGLWQFRLGGNDAGAGVEIEDSMWVDGDGRPHAIEQLVIQGMASRGGGQFSWLLKKMG